MPAGSAASEVAQFHGADGTTVSGHGLSVDARDLLAPQNRERARLGLAPLEWNDRLAREAHAWAARLAQRQALEHSGGTQSGMGENLWMGTGGAWSREEMVDFFIRERRFFRDARFPHVSSTGNWVDVGHYTQIVWRDTREVGCAVASANRIDVLVCRYYPAGNVIGRSPY